MALPAVESRRCHVVRRKGTGRETTRRPIVFASRFSKRVLPAGPQDEYGMDDLDAFWKDDCPDAPDAKPAASPPLPAGAAASLATAASTPALAAGVEPSPMLKKPPGGLLLARTPVAKPPEDAAPALPAPTSGGSSGRRLSARQAARRSPREESAEDPDVPHRPPGGYLLARTPVHKPDDAAAVTERATLDAGASAVAQMLDSAADEADGGAPEAEPSVHGGASEAGDEPEGADAGAHVDGLEEDAMDAAADVDAGREDEHGGFDDAASSDRDDDSHEEGDAADDDDDDDDDDDGEFGAGTLEDAEAALDESEPTLIGESAKPPHRMSVDAAEAAKAKRKADRKRRRGPDASCIHPSLEELERRARERADEDHGLRRTRRKRMSPLKFWKNERPVYGRRQSAKFAAIVDVLKSDVAEPPPPSLAVERARTAPSAHPKGSAKPAKPAPSAASKQAGKRGAAGGGAAAKASGSAAGPSAPSAAAEPKKMSGFMVFANEQRPIIKAAEPSIPFGELGKRIGERWRALADAERAEYTQRGAGSAPAPPKAGTAHSATPDGSEGEEEELPLAKRVALR